MPIVEMPNGDRVSFPDDMPKEEIRALIASKFPEVAQGQAKSPVRSSEKRDGKGILEKVDAGVRGAADMLTFGFADEIAAGLGTGFGYLGDYDKELARQRGIDKFDSENNTYSRVAGQVAGGLAGGIGAAKNGATLLTRKALEQGGKQAIARAAGEGAIYGGLYGAGSGEDADSRLSGAAKGAATGAVAGAAFQKAGNALATKIAGRQAAKAAPDLAELKDEAGALYDAMRSSGMVVKQAPLDKMRANVALTMKATSADLSPKAAALASKLDETLANPTNIVDLHNVSKLANRVMREVKPGGEDAMYVSRIKTIVDSAIDGLKMNDVTGADPVAVAGMKKAADQLWGRAKKAQVLENIMESADVRSGQYSQSGMANAIRTEMRQLWRRIKSGKEKGFSSEEVALIKQMAKGGSSSQLVNLLAKFSPRGLLSASLPAGIGASFGGPVGAIIPGAVGHVAGRAADASAIQALQSLRTAAATGKVPIGVGGRQIGTAATAPLIRTAPGLLDQERRHIFGR